MSRIALVLLLIGLLPLAGCKRPTGTLQPPRLEGRPAKVFATTGMIADAAKAVGGEYVVVDCLMGPGVDPHKYIPSPNDLARIQNADLVLYNGLHLEGKMTDVLEARGRTAWTAAVAEGLPDLRNSDEGSETTHDPHVWFDVRLWMKVVEKVRDTLIEIDAAHATQYTANAAEYLGRLERLDREVRDKLATVPESKRVLITAHDAFGYFGRAYGFEVLGLQGISTVSDVGTPDVQALADVIGRRKIPTIFTETSVPEKGVQSVLQAVRMRYKGVECHISPDQLYSDALGPAGSPGETYIGMVRHNVDAIVRGLTK